MRDTLVTFGTAIALVTLFTSCSFAAISEEGSSILEELKAKQQTSVEKTADKPTAKAEAIIEKTAEPAKTAVHTLPTPQVKPAPAIDLIKLRNGDRISGKLVDIFDGKVKIAAYGNDKIFIPFKDIASINTVDEYKITIKEGSVLEGRFAGIAADALVVKTGVGPVPAKRDQIVSADNLPAVAAKKAAAEEAARFDLDKVWDGRASLGLVQTTGNSEAKALSLGFEATRKSEQDKLFLDAQYNKNKADGVVSSDFIRGGARIDVYLKNKSFYFLMGRMEIDKLQDLDLRTTIGAGLGRTFYDYDMARLDMGLGITYERENYEAQSTESERTLLYTLNYDKKFNDQMKFTERLMVFPTIDELSDYRIESNAGFHYALSDTFGLNLGFLYRYDKTPQAGSKRNDATFTTSITQKF